MRFSLRLYKRQAVGFGLALQGAALGELPVWGTGLLSGTAA